MLNIHIKTIPHPEQRYPILGDYWRDKQGKQQLRVSDLGNDDYAFMIAVHELVEWYLTEKRGIKEEDIKAYDEMFEEERLKGIQTDEADPGMDPRAPYRKEHAFATEIEKQLATELGVDWEKYSEKINTIFAAWEASPETKAGSKPA